MKDSTANDAAAKGGAVKCGTVESEAAIGWRFLASRRWFGYYAMLLIFAIACVWLGNWQFARRAEAQAEIARIDANYDSPAIALTTALPDPGAFDLDSLKWQTVEARGVYEGEPFLARNRPGAGGIGSNLVQALRLEDGRVFFVDRGWVQVAGTEAAKQQLPEPATGEVTVLARLRASEPEIAGRSAAGRSVPSINLSALAEHFDGVVFTGAYGQLVSEQPAGEHGVLAQRPERDEGPHLSYALQWYVFILIALVGVGYAAKLEHRSVNGPPTEGADAEQRAKRRRRGRSDADEEDALLDG